MNIIEVFFFLTCTFTILMWLTGVATCRKIIQQKSTNQVSFFPFMIMFCSATLWTKYGLIMRDQVLIYVNLCGSILNAVFMLIFYWYTIQKSALHRQLTLGAFLLFSPLIYVAKFSTSEMITVKNLGLVCSASSLMAYGSPLSAIKEVVKSKSTETMSLPLSVMAVIVSSMWAEYGVIMTDPFIQVPNTIGALLGVVQLLLFVKYRRHHHHRTSVTTT